MQPLELAYPTTGLHLLTGANGAGKSWAARALAARVAGAAVLSAESQQAFYEAELAADQTDFLGEDARDSGTTVQELVGEAGRQHPLFTALQLQALGERGYRLLSTGEARKVLLLRALLQNPSLVILDDPFDGLDVASCAELSRALVGVAERVAVVLVGGFLPAQLPVPSAAIASVVVIEQRQVAFRGSFDAWRQYRATNSAPRCPPPVELGRYYEPPPAGEPLIRLVRGHVKYGDQVVFEGLDFTVMPGQHTLIEGPNGSGKSTLVEMVSGDLPQAYSNDLHLFGRRRGTGETVWDIKKNVGLGAPAPRLPRRKLAGGRASQRPLRQHWLCTASANRVNARAPWRGSNGSS